MGLDLADVGLVQRGINEGQEQANKLALDEQRVKTGQIGLDEVTRQRDTAAKMRSAVSSANPAEGRAGVYHRVSEEALRSGDYGTYEAAQKASKALQDEGFGQLAMHALTGTPPDQAAKAFNESGTQRVVPESVEYGKDPKTGDILVRGTSVQDGKPYTFNATQYARMHGIIKPTVHTIPAGGSLAITEPGQETKVVTGRDKTYSPSQAVIHVERSSEDGQKKTYAYNVDTQQWIGGAPPGENGAPPEAEDSPNIRKHLPVLKAVDEAVSKIPGAVNKMDLSDPLHPYYEWTPKGQAYATRAQKLYLANPKLPPEQIREIVSSAELQARIVNGEESELRYKGKTYKLGNVPASAAAPAAPAPTPQAPQPVSKPSTASTSQPAELERDNEAADRKAKEDYAKAKTQDERDAIVNTTGLTHQQLGGRAEPARQAPKPAPKPATPKQESKPGLQPAKAEEDDLPQVVEVPRGSSPKERAQSDRAKAAKELAGRKDVVDAAVSAGKAVVDKMKPAKPDEVFRTIVASGRMTVDDAPLIQEAIDTGKLGPADELKAHRMLAKLRQTTAGR